MPSDHLQSQARVSWLLFAWYWWQLALQHDTHLAGTCRRLGVQPGDPCWAEMDAPCQLCSGDSAWCLPGRTQSFSRGSVRRLRNQALSSAVAQERLPDVAMANSLGNVTANCRSLGFCFSRGSLGPRTLGRPCPSSLALRCPDFLSTCHPSLQ